MSFEKFIEEYLEKGLPKKQKPDTRAIDRMILRAEKDLKAAKANLKIDEEIVQLTGISIRRRWIYHKDHRNNLYKVVVVCITDKRIKTAFLSDEVKGGKVIWIDKRNLIG